MKKLKLTLADLEVSSFIAQNKDGRAGTVNGMQQMTGFTVCYCTNYGDCQHSLYCSNIPGAPNNTCYEGCMTNEMGAC